MKLKHVSPAEYVIHVFGGVVKTARALGRAPSSISEWQPKTIGGRSSGLVPSSIQKKVLQIAKRKNLPITEIELVFGGKIKVK